MARLWGATLSANTFTVLGAGAELGRTLVAGDATNPNVVVLSFDTWRRLFDSDPAAVGATIEFRADFNASLTPELVPPRLVTIVGVMPAAFELPSGPMDYYTPLVVDGSKRSPRVTLFGRLRPGVSLTAALEEANVDRQCDRAAAARQRSGAQRAAIRSARHQRTNGRGPAARASRAPRRRSGSTPHRLRQCREPAAGARNDAAARDRRTDGDRRQPYTDRAAGPGGVRVLAAAGGALGAAVGAAGVALVKSLTAVDAPGIFRLGFGTSILPRGHEVGVDPKLFAIAFGIAAITSVMCGVLPALHMSRTSSLHAMGSRGSNSGRREPRIRAALVVVQLAMATVLLVSAGLLINSFVRLSTVERGYDPENVLAFQLVLPPQYSIARKTETIEEILARLRATPDVESAGFTRAGILIGEAITLGTFVPPGRTVNEMRAGPVRPLIRAVSAGYLTAVGAHLLDGRDFEAADAAGSTPVIVISRGVARQYFGAASPIGQFVDWHVGQGPPAQMRVVGVVDDVRNTSPDREGSPEIFVEYRHLLALQQRWGDSTQRQEQLAIGFLSFAIRTRGNPAAAAPIVSRIVRAVDSNVGIDAMIPMERLVASSVARPRFYAVLLGVFAGVAGLLAAIGIYGVLAYAVVQRTREIGIRMALGAPRGKVLLLVLRSGALLATLGIALGLAGAAATTRWLQSLLFGVAPLDPTTFSAVSLAFGAVAALASYVPARRATNVDPMVALRSE